MTTTRTILLAILFASQASAAPTSPIAQSPEGATLHALFEKEWEYTMRMNPTWASRLGDRRWNDRWEEVTPSAFQREQDHNVGVLAELGKIERPKSPADQLNYDLFKNRYELQVEEFPYKWHLIALNQRDGIQTSDELADALRFQTVKDYEDWIARLRSFGAHADQTMALMHEGIRERILLPKVTMRRVPAQIAKQIVADPEQSPMFKPLKSFPAEISAAEQRRLASEGRNAVEQVVLPAFTRLKKFFDDEYLPACYDGVGAWRLPNGTNMYAFFARRFTTTSLTPREIHDIGLREVARIRAEMEKIKKRAGFDGELAAFFEHLRTDERYFCKSADELLLTYRAVAKRIDPTLVKLFRTHPQTPYGVEPIPDKIAPDTTTAYYRQPAADGSRAGTYFVNLYKPETRPKWEMMALSLHEGVPGHHFQIALAQEQGEIPKFRRHGSYTAYVEGWGLYAESLGDEVGLYDNPYDKMGQLTYEMWRAVRLVVDTGMHALGWDRERAIAYFKDNAPKTEQDIVNEIDRYISWPGQALAYKIGELKIKELRTRAKEKLGSKFDVKDFHDVVLLSGAMPLDLLEQRVMDWIRLGGGSYANPATTTSRN
jgi:uncharacterized protein (DUF885 family)